MVHKEVWTASTDCFKLQVSAKACNNTSFLFTSRRVMCGKFSGVGESKFSIFLNNGRNHLDETLSHLLDGFCQLWLKEEEWKGSSLPSQRYSHTIPPESEMTAIQLRPSSQFSTCKTPGVQILGIVISFLAVKPKWMLCKSIHFVQLHKLNFGQKVSRT